MTAVTVLLAKSRSRTAQVRRQQALLPWGFLAPSVVILGLMTIYPLVYAVVLSFRSGSFVSIDQWAGVQNYDGLVHDGLFGNAVRFSAIFTFATVALTFLLGLGLALGVNRFRRGGWLLRMALLMPWVVPSVVSVLAWRWLVSDNGALVNRVLGLFGIAPVAFLASPFWATVMVILLRVWRTFPFMFITLLAARQGVPPELYEAAALDSAGALRTFWHITLPQLSRVAIIGGLLVAIWSFNDFETIFLLTQGGPSNATYNVVVYAYYQAFFGGDVGLAAAAGVVGLLLLIVLAVVVLRLLARVERT